MEPVVVDYLTSKLLDDLRENRSLDRELALAFNRYPLIDALRRRVGERDVTALMDAAMAPGSTFLIAISLLRQFDRRDDVQAFLLDRWKAWTDYERRMELLWRILDDENLNSELHEELYSFVQMHFERFVADCASTYGGSDNVLSVVRDRLSDESFPRTKSWAYLCAAAGSPDVAGASELFDKYLASDDPFVRRVAGDLARRIK